MNSKIEQNIIEKVEKLQLETKESNQQQKEHEENKINLQINNNKNQQSEKLLNQNLENQNEIIQIVLDTETTGLSPFKGDHRIIEIGCIKLINYQESAETFHCYFNPERKMEGRVVKTHGLTNKFLEQFKPFNNTNEKIDQFLDFIKDYPLIIHNAAFDLRFINHHLEQIGKQSLTNQIIDTLKLARKMFPKQPNNLDALCERLSIDNKKREKGHGAIIDSQLLIQVYQQLRKIQEEKNQNNLKAQNDVEVNSSNINNNFNIYLKKDNIQNNESVQSQIFEENKEQENEEDDEVFKLQQELQNLTVQELQQNTSFKNNNNIKKNNQKNNN